MKNLIQLLIVLSIFPLSVKSQSLSEPKRVIILGKVLNIEPDKRTINLYVNRPGLGQMQVDAEADSIGNFSASFESYTPTDVWVMYKTNFLVLTHPGDSIYIEFDGRFYDRPEILKTIKFSGDAVKTNQEASVFQGIYFSNPLYTDWDSKNRKIKEYEPDQYLLYLDTMKLKGRQLFDHFVEKVSPGEESKIWALTYIEGVFYYTLSFYPLNHQSLNKLSQQQWDVPVSFYDPLKKWLPLTRDMLICGDAISGFASQFHSFFLRNRFLKEVYKKYNLTNGITPALRDTLDSLFIESVIQNTPDTLLRQMILTDFFNNYFRSTKVDAYEKNRDKVDLYITELFLKKPLEEMYHQLKMRLEKPEIVSGAILKKIETSSIKQVFDSIFVATQGKVIYIDCWATWCAPCLSEFPNSKRLMEKMKGKDVGFVYLCLESPEAGWKSNLDKFKLEGQHYFLTEKQSSDLRKVFEVQGIPYYFLYDKNKVLVDKGSHLRPDAVEEKIVELLKK